MIFKNFLLVFLGFKVVMNFFVEERASDQKNLIQALSIISNEITVQQGSIDVISACNGYRTKDFTDSLLRASMQFDKFKIRIQSVDFLNSNQVFESKIFSIVIVDNIEDFMDFSAKFYSSNFKIYGKIIVVLVNGSLPGISKIFSEFWKRNFYNVIIVYEAADHVPILTFIPYRSEHDCSNTTELAINLFINGTFTKGIENIFIKKMRNLQKCDIRVASSNNSSPHISLVSLPNGTTFWEGRDFDVITAIAQGLNATLNFTYIGSLGYIYENGTAFGSLEKVLNNDADLSLGDWWLKLLRLTYYDATVSYISEQIRFVVPYGSELSSAEKLIYPLSVTSWAIFIGFISCGVIVIFITKKQPQTIQDFLIGEKVKYPYFNIVIGILGLSQEQLPRKNFARFLLTNFLLFALVLRTVYQGKLFEMMKLNMKHSEPNNMYDIADSGYEVVYPDNYIDFMASKSFKHRVW